MGPDGEGVAVGCQREAGCDQALFARVNTYTAPEQYAALLAWSPLMPVAALERELAERS